MLKKIIFVIIIILSICTFLSNFQVVQAKGLGEIINGAQDFENSGKPVNQNDHVIEGEIVQDVSSILYNALLILGTCIAVIIAAVLGLKFITGSVEEKVQVKESLIPFLIGCITLFGAFGIWRLVILLIR